MEPVKKDNYTFTVIFLVREENKAEARQSLKDYIDEIMNDTDCSEHGILNISIKDKRA